MIFHKSHPHLRNGWSRWHISVVVFEKIEQIIDIYVYSVELLINIFYNVFEILRIFVISNRFQNHNFEPFFLFLRTWLDKTLKLSLYCFIVYVHTFIKILVENAINYLVIYYRKYRGIFTLLNLYFCDGFYQNYKIMNCQYLCYFWQGIV